ncbi:MAG: MBOAT family protein [Myxococcales bacterium]
MLFNSPLYGVFLVSAFVLFWLLRTRHLARGLFLVAASYGFYFYGTWDISRDQAIPTSPLVWATLCLAIIFLGSTLDFFIGRALGKTQSPPARKALLLVSIGYYLGVLALFKYFNFAADSFSSAAQALGLRVDPVHLRLVLPFGISFFTFETMSYTIDVYRRELEPSNRYVDYLLFVCFFPHLVAGPIVRPRSMLPQLAAAPKFDPEEQAQGLWLIATGLAKKMILGDLLAVNLVARVFENPERYSSVEVLFAVYGYAVQIYADFSGYTDVALGSALLFGYRLPKNFDSPYTAMDLQDFWRRWHVSLSSWLRDYLYIPLGGSREGGWRTYRNLMITMLLGGLWHGASWNFVLWGALHGAGLAATRAWQRWRGRDEGSRGLLARGVGVAATFHFVCLAWVFFRAPSFSHAVLMLRQLVSLSGGTTVLTAQVLVLIGVGLSMQWVPSGLGKQFARLPSVAQGAVLAAFAIVLHLVSRVAPQPFVYGQF